VLCVLRTDVQQIDKRQATAELHRLQQRLAELEAGTRKEELARAKAALDEAKVLLAKWEREKLQVQRSYEANAASEKEYRDTMAEYQAAALRVAQAAAAYEQAVNGPRPEQIAQARHAVEAQRAAVDRIADRIAKATIRAPFTGFVTRKMTEVGQWVTAGGPVAEMVELDTVLVRVDVPEDYIARVQPGQQATIRLESLAEYFEGDVKHVIPQASAASRAFPVEIEVPNPNHRIKAGMFARAMLPLGEPSEQLLVPKDAVRVTPQGTIVFTVGQVPAKPGTAPHGAGPPGAGPLAGGKPPAGASKQAAAPPVGIAWPTPVIVTGGWKGFFTVEGAIQPGTPVIVRGNERLHVDSGQLVVVVGQGSGAAGLPPAGAPERAGSAPATEN